MKPSVATVAGAGIGAPAATVLVWILKDVLHVVVPQHVEPAIGALVAIIVAYCFKGGQANDTNP